jgi:hypothetical protein
MPENADNDDGRVSEAGDRAIDAEVVPIAEVSQALPALTNDLRRFDVAASLAIVGGLLADPSHHAHTLRLELLGHLIALHSVGAMKPTSRDTQRWLTSLQRAEIGRYEDPLEDVFASNVITARGNRRLFQGLSPNAEFWVQQLPCQTDNRLIS